MTASRSRSPWKFFSLVFALSIPFWLLGGLTGLQLLPGLPTSALSAFCPAIAACILVYRENATEGMKELLSRSFDYKRIKAKVWYVPIVLLMPVAAILSYGLMRLMGLPLPTPHFPILFLLGIFLAAVVAALGEELGWSGYALDPLQDRWNALMAAVLVGLVWAIWHWVMLIQAHRPPVWIAWWSVGTVARRVLTVWLYNNTGKSVFAAVLFHAMGNVSWQMFPIYGSHWDPRMDGLIIAFVATIVAAVWGPRTLARR
jgi:membrane protease YdiL (CAAX protease family)